MLRVIVGGIVVIASALFAVYLNTPRQIEAPQRQRPAGRPGSSRNRARRNIVLERIQNRTLVCMICLETLAVIDLVWFCYECLNAGHHRCLRTHIDGGGTFCPTCRKDISNGLPLMFTCMCGRIRNPSPNTLRPFSCNSCVNCGDVCHPGPC